MFMKLFSFSIVAILFGLAVFFFVKRRIALGVGVLLAGIGMLVFMPWKAFSNSPTKWQNEIGWQNEWVEESSSPPPPPSTPPQTVNRAAQARAAEQRARRQSELAEHKRQRAYENSFGYRKEPVLFEQDDNDVGDRRKRAMDELTAVIRKAERQVIQTQRRERLRQLLNSD